MKSSSQNIIAIVWDFDKTLIPYYMQKPLFEEYGVNEEKFWNEEVNKLPELYKNLGVSLSPDTAYLNHILSYVREGIFSNLTNTKLRELGGRLDFFPGMPEFFEESKQLLNQKEEYKKFDLKLEHYIVSTGLTEMIRGSKISPYVDGIWGCEFIEDFFVLKNGSLVKQAQGQISSIAYQIDNTTKTRALFEINKGVNVHPDDINVNQMMPEEVRRVPFENMIYIADGPSDVPAFSVMKKNGGKTFAVFNKSIPQSFKQAQVLFKEGRVDNCFEADYRKDTHAYLWLTNEISDIADKIITKKKSQLRQGKEKVPVHFN
jgi:hypothetical protein